MATVKSEYVGQLSTKNIHVSSGAEIVTDAPVDNKGLGRTFSPTDLVATALFDCMLTTVAILSERKNINVDNTKAEITKIMSTTTPRKITEIKIDIFMNDKSFSQEDRKFIEEVAKKCPVSLALSPDIFQNITFHW